MTEPSAPTGGSPAAMFAVPADAYDRLIGRFLPTLGPALADAAEVRPPATALDVGCGPGGLTRELVARLGASSVAAIDPSPPFVAACQHRNPGVDVRQGVAEDLPWPENTFDVTLACLVVGFMSDPVRGAAEMRRVTRPGGRIAACFWDYEQMPMIQTFWRAADLVIPDNPGEVDRLGRRPGDLVELLIGAGATEVRELSLTATSEYTDVDDWWAPFALGVGPAGAYCRSLSEPQQQEIRQRGAELLGSPEGRFRLEARAWCAVGTA